MSNNDKNETESPDIIEEIIPGKNNDYNDKSIGQNNNNNQQPFIENYDEQESAQAVIEATEEPKKSIETMMAETGNQVPQYTQSITDNQEHNIQTTRDITENYLEMQKQAIDSFQSVFIPYFQNTQNQLWNNQEYFKSISAMYSRFVSNYLESAMAFSRMWIEVAYSNMNFLRNANNSSSVNESRMSNFEVDSGRNSDENSTNIKATFSCESCGQTFDSRQVLKEHASITHYK
jgi:hypothetical protein